MESFGGTIARAKIFRSHERAREHLNWNWNFENTETKRQKRKRAKRLVFLRNNFSALFLTFLFQYWKWAIIVPVNNDD